MAEAEIDPILARYRYEYVSPVLELGPITAGQEWSLMIFLANRDRTVESFDIYMVQGGLHQGMDTLEDQNSIQPGHTGGWGVGFEAAAGVDNYEVRWARIFVTSRNLVPTLQYYVMDAEGQTPPVGPLAAPFYVPPGGFALFDVAPDVTLPPIGPATPMS
jgi:hypothetical protein